MKKIAIVIPAYNEEKRIGNTLEQYSSYFEKLRLKNSLDYELLIVINNTKDNTEAIVKRVASKNKRIRYLNFKQGGKGFAVLEGFKDALTRDNDWIGFVDADMATSPEAFYALLKKLNGFDGVIASRYVPGAVVSPRPVIQRMIVSRIFNMLIRALFFMPYRDTQCGAKIFTRDAIRSIIGKTSMTQYAFDVDLIFLLRRENKIIKEIPTVWSDKEYSKVNFIKVGPWMSLALVRLRLLNSPFKGFIRLYDRILSSRKY